VLDQSVESRHFLVVDGFPCEVVESWDCEHITLSKSHADNGNTPRAIGALSAINLGYEVILFLDADNWYSGDHVAEALSLKKLNPDADIAVLGRRIVLPNGVEVPRDSEDDSRSHIDTSCYCFFPSAFSLLPLWGMMLPCLGPICDRVMFFAVHQKKYKIAWSDKKTCFFTSNYRLHYLAARQAPPVKTNDPDMLGIVRKFQESKPQFRARTGLSFDLSYKLKTE